MENKKRRELQRAEEKYQTDHGIIRNVVFSVLRKDTPTDLPYIKSLFAPTYHEHLASHLQGFIDEGILQLDNESYILTQVGIDAVERRVEDTLKKERE